MTIQTRCIACNNKLDEQIISSAGILCRSCKSQGLFRKKIIITGITRMNGGNICVSGIDEDTWRFVRPVFSSGLNRSFVLNGDSQVIKHFSKVEIEFKQYRPSAEFHTEDWVINENFSPRFLGYLKDEEIISLLNKMAITNLNQEISNRDKSLFIVKVKRITDIFHEYSFGKFKVRVSFEDASGNHHYNVPATDLLLLASVRYEVEIGHREYKNRIINQFNNNPFKYIRIGLTREFLGQNWKQVTALINIPDLFGGKSFSDFEKKLGMCA